jgi:hypothetical protein
MIADSHREILTARRAEIVAALADAEGRLAAAINDWNHAVAIEAQIADEREKLRKLVQTAVHPHHGLSTALSNFEPTIKPPSPSSAGIRMAIDGLNFNIEDLRLGLHQIDQLLTPPPVEPEPEEAAPIKDGADFDLIVFPGRKDAAE